MKIIIFTALAFLCTSCVGDDTKVLSFLKEGASEQKIDGYWYQGKAEITSYSLLQNRYKDEHPGHAVLIFVTEDFLTDKQVKNEGKPGKGSTGVLKNNRIKRFTTGLYDYSMMTSAFSPVNRDQHPHALKVSMSSQDWCGQSYQQINLKESSYVSTLHSYFEDEADRSTVAPLTWMEDEFFNLIRINPEALPEGDIEVIPMLEFLRLRHLPFESVNGQGRLSDYSGQVFVGEDIKQYHLSYPELNRTFSIYYENIRPFKIVGWQETYPSAFDGKIRTTTAVKKEELFEPYWKLNHLENTGLREKLGI